MKSKLLLLLGGILVLASFVKITSSVEAVAEEWLPIDTPDIFPEEPPRKSTWDERMVVLATIGTFVFVLVVAFCH